MKEVIGEVFSTHLDVTHWSVMLLFTYICKNEYWYSLKKVTLNVKLAYIMLCDENYSYIFFLIVIV